MSSGGVDDDDGGCGDPSPDRDCDWRLCFQNLVMRPGQRDVLSELDEMQYPMYCVTLLNEENYQAKIFPAHIVKVLDRQYAEDKGTPPAFKEYLRSSETQVQQLQEKIPKQLGMQAANLMVVAKTSTTAGTKNSSRLKKAVVLVAYIAAQNKKPILEILEQHLTMDQLSRSANNLRTQSQRTNFRCPQGLKWETAREALRRAFKKMQPMFRNEADEEDFWFTWRHEVGDKFCYKAKAESNKWTTPQTSTMQSPPPLYPRKRKRKHGASQDTDPKRHDALDANDEGETFDIIDSIDIDAVELREDFDFLDELRDFFINNSHQ